MTPPVTPPVTPPTTPTKPTTTPLPTTPIGIPSTLAPIRTRTGARASESVANLRAYVTEGVRAFNGTKPLGVA